MEEETQIQKTIFITSFHGLVSRVLESGILEELTNSGVVKVVIFVPDFKKEYFESVFADGDRISIEGISEDRLPRITYLLHRLSFVLLDTKTMRIIRQSYRGYKYYYQFLIAQLIASSFGRWRAVRMAFRYINFLLLRNTGSFSVYFDKYKPDLVFSTDVKGVTDTQLLVESKKRGVKTVAMVRSWDYLTGKGMTRVTPDKMIVHNQIIKEEAIRIADIRAENIYIVGIPHFDPYINDQRSSRGDFFRRIGISPERRLILLAPLGDKFSNTDYQIFEIICSAIKNNELPKNLSVLVRLPPGDTVRNTGSVCNELVFDFPGISFDGKPRKSNEMTLSDIRHLADSIYHSEIVITGPSTIAIDAAVFDKPIVFLAFDGKCQKSYYQSYVHIYDFNHMQNLMKTDGYQIAQNPKEFITSINRTLQNPLDKKIGRAQIIKEQCFNIDGKSNKRLADILLSFIL